MPLLNYTTEIPVETTIGEIQKILISAKAQQIMTDFAPDGVVVAISFRVTGPWGIMSFRLPANVNKIFAIISRNTKTERRLRTREQAARVAWRIIKDWLAAQLALMRAEMVTLEQVFLPYAQNSDGVTLYDALAEGKFRGLALPSSTPNPSNP